MRQTCKKQVDGLQAQYDELVDRRKEQLAMLEQMTVEEAAKEKQDMIRAEQALKDAEAKLKSTH